MPSLESLSTQLQTMSGRLARIEKELKKATSKEVWVSEEKAMAITGISKKTLQVMRRNGKLKFRSLETGRKFQYDLNSIENLFI